MVDSKTEPNNIAKAAAHNVRRPVQQGYGDAVDDTNDHEYTDQDGHPAHSTGVRHSAFQAN